MLDTTLFAGETPSGTLGGSALASWTPVVALLVGYVVVVSILWFRGEPGKGDLNPLGALQRIGRGLTRLTSIPGWAAAAIGQAMFGLLLAGVGFYSDVAWHIALGRDDELLTAPHTGILLGLVFFFAASLVGVIIATLDRYEGGFRLGALRVPNSMIPLFALGAGALSGFPMDEVWHSAFGVDVTMWSPTHMLMILGASFVGLASWLILADVGIKPTDSPWAAGLHGFAAWLTLQGLVASLGEFAFGVPQYAHVFHPIVVSLASGLGLVAIRIVMGRGRCLLIAVIAFVSLAAPIGGDGPVETHEGALFIGSALAIELVALLFGTKNRTRFAVASGVAIGTFGLATEWVYNQGAPQPWRTTMLPEAVIWSVLAAIGGALLAVGFSTAFSWTAVAGRSRTAGMGATVLAGTLLVVAPIALNLSREVSSDVEVAITVTPTNDGTEAIIGATLSPADAADEAHWFMVSAWQGGGLVLEDLEEVSAGVYETTSPVPIDGLWKTVIRLHRDSELMAAPIWFPADPEIDEPEIAAVDRTVFFAAETDFLLRETFTDDSKAWLSPVVHGYLGLVLLSWLGAFIIGVRRIGGQAPALVEEPAKTPVPA